MDVSELAQMALQRRTEATAHVRYWQGRIATLEAVVGALSGGDGRPPTPPRWRRVRWAEVLPLVEDHLRDRGAVATAREVEGWLGREHGVELPRGKLRMQLWASPRIAYDAAKGGWHLPAAPGGNTGTADAAAWHTGEAPTPAAPQMAGGPGQSGPS